MNNQRNQRYSTGRLRNFDDDIQNIVESVINEYLSLPQTRATAPTFGRPRQPMSATAQSNTNTQGETYVEYMSLLHALRDIMLGYNTAMRDYSQNISTFLQIMQSVQYDLSRTRQTRNNLTTKLFMQIQNQSVHSVVRVEIHRFLRDRVLLNWMAQLMILQDNFLDIYSTQPREHPHFILCSLI